MRNRYGSDGLSAFSMLLHQGCSTLTWGARTNLLRLLPQQHVNGARTAI
jgi:hypothetical protein